jgi:uncharacterized protein (TIGR02145 family)
MKKVLLFLFVIIGFSHFGYAQRYYEPIWEGKTRLARIGTQVWTRENLEVLTFRNGDSIPQAINASAWVSASENQQPAWCYYEFNSNNGRFYGKLYNWYAVRDSRGLAPLGFHIPSDEEWTILTNYLEKDPYNPGKPGKLMKSDDTRSWSNYGYGGNQSNFSGLPGGYCSDRASYYFFLGIGEKGEWWSSTYDESANGVYTRSLHHDAIYCPKNLQHLGSGVSVRCVKD